MSLNENEMVERIGDWYGKMLTWWPQDKLSRVDDIIYQICVGHKFDGSKRDKILETANKYTYFYYQDRYQPSISAKPVSLQKLQSREVVIGR